MNNVKYLCIGIEEIDNSMFKTIENVNRYVPDGGLWGSIFISNGEFKSNWHEFCSRELNSMIRNYGVLFSVLENSKGYVIDSLDDLLKLHNKFHYTWRDRELLDFEKITENYDYLILTEKGEEETRSPMYSLYAWDSECILILNKDCIESSEYTEW